MDRYKDIDFVCIDELEARLPSGDKQTDIEIIGESIKKDNNFKNLIITRGHSGQIFICDDGALDIRALAKNTIDTVGAGDAAYAMATICMVSGMSKKETLMASSLAGAQATQIVCNKEPSNKKHLLKMLKNVT